MPRNGKGQKVQTGKGQQYGAVKAQEESQAVVPLPQMPEPGAMAAAPPVDPSQRPGGAGAFNRPSENPMEDVRTQINPSTVATEKPLDDIQRYKALNKLMFLMPMADDPLASPHLRNTVRRLKAMVGDPADFKDKKPTAEMINLNKEMS